MLTSTYRLTKAYLFTGNCSAQVLSFRANIVQGIRHLVSPTPPVYAQHTPNFATSAAKLVCRASRKGCSTWSELELRPPRIRGSELDFKAILNSFPFLKVVISILDYSIIILLSLINISSKYPISTSIGYLSSYLPI